MIQVKIVNRKLVKPCIPTPQNLQNYKLSFTDELAEAGKFGVLLFYASKPKETQINLEESLAKVLFQFYPLAGRLKMKDRCVDCSDQGAEFVEARASEADLATLISERNLGNLDSLFPADNIHQQFADEANYPILSVQTTHLKCSGLAIAICVSHRIFDASSMGTFVAAWSNASNPRSNTATYINPIFNSESLLPAKIQNGSPYSQVVRETSPAVVKRFVFDKEAIGRLRSKLRQGMMSRVRVVSAFIAKALIRVDGAKQGGTARRCFILQLINMRERTIPPMAKHACGNLVIRSCTEAKDIGFQELADLMSEDVDRSISKCSEILSLDEDGLNKLMVESLMGTVTASLSGEANLVWFTDWSKFGFYEVDFGWGEPVGATVAPAAIANGFPGAVLMGNKEGDGIEAWVCLDEHDMALFEQDEEIRMLAT